MRNQQDIWTAQYVAKHRRYKIWQRIVSMLACVVVFCTTYALILPAITQETKAYCEIEEHKHTDECYESVTIPGSQEGITGETVPPALVCTLPEAEAHTHTETCYALAHTHMERCFGEVPLICGEQEGIHTHSEGCYGEETRTLICELEESEPHTHTDSCYTLQAGELICTDETEGHEHTRMCYTECKKVRACDQEETAEHHHGAKCWQTGEKPLICTLSNSEPHVHTESCYGEAPLTCGLQERETEELICGLEETEGHKHSDVCYEIPAPEETAEIEKNLICDLEEHEHDLKCFSDVTADLETESVWKKTLPGTLSGVWREDVAAIAASQLGYAESTRNYVVENEEIYGYSRYGAWYGDPYGNWCAMFASFCLHYAGVEGMPYDSVCRDWITELTEAELYTAEEGYVPQGGDVIFFDLNQNGNSDHVGIVESVTDATDASEAKVTAIEGNSADRVQRVSYPLSDQRIVGYGLIPAQPEKTEPEETVPEETRPPLSEEQRLQVDDVIFLIDVLPDVDEIRQNFADLEAPGKEAEKKAYRAKIEASVHAASESYEALPEELRDYVTNAQKLAACSELLAELPVEGADVPVVSDAPNISAQVTTDAALPERVTFRMSPVEQSPEASAQAAAFLEGMGSELLELTVLDLHFADADGAEYPVQGETEVTLTFDEPIPAGDNNVFLLHFTENGAENVTRRVQRDENGVSSITMRTDSFSEYGIAVASASSVVNVNVINRAYWGEAPAVILFHQNNGMYIKDLVTAHFSGNNVFVVETVNGTLQVTEKYGKDVESKQNVYASGSGFILVECNCTLNLNVGDKISASSDFWRTDEKLGYEANGHGSLTFTSGAENYPRPDKNNAVPTVPSADTSQIINVNLWNYGSNINEKWRADPNYPGFQYPGGAQTGGLSRWNMAYGDNIVADTADNTWINVTGTGAPGGAVNGNGKDFIEGAISNNLGADGFPALTYNNDSLSWLFSSNTYAAKQNTANINGLFRYNPENGEYFYDSRLNHAQYANNTFTLYDAWISSNFIMYPFGNFLPFNNINTETTHAPDADRQWFLDVAAHAQYKFNNGADGRYATLAQAIRDAANEMDGFYPNGWGAEQLVRKYFEMERLQDSDKPVGVLPNIYSIDYDIPTDFFFGMDMNMTFMQPKDGVTGPHNNYDMVFRFVGDDDVWVYIDGVLFLDLTGIHRHKGGTIDFVNGVVSYYDLDPATGDISTTPSKTYTFAQMLEKAGKPTSVLNEKGTFKDYTTHSFKFYFMERGSGSSVCKMNFNFPLLRQNSISVEKGVASDSPILGDPDYLFQILAADAAGNKMENLFITAGTSYTIYDQSGNKLGTGTTDSNGVFALKAGQRAEFTGIQENAGKYYVRELLEGTVLEQYGNVTVSGESTTTSNDIVVGTDKFTGMDSPVKDMSDGATSFHFTNDVDEKKLGRLSISKVLLDFSKARTARTFDIQVSLDGQPLPVGTAYTVGEETRTVETTGIITIKAGEAAVISDILAGTAFVVQETSDSADGYRVTYTDSGGYTITVEDGAAKGVIKTSAAVQLMVTNAEKGAVVTIPGTKSQILYDGTERTYTMRLEEVTDQTGTTLKEGGLTGYTASAVVKDAPADFSFTINYVQVQMDDLPQTFYYRITEDPSPDNGWRENHTQYVAEVTVNSDEKGELVAFVSKLWKDGTKTEAIRTDFVNILTGGLSLEKFVNGGTEDRQTGFAFTITLDKGTSGLESLPESYPAVLYQQDGTTAETTLTLSNGQIKLTDFKHGERIVITGIPVGAYWQIEEAPAERYTVETLVTVGSGDPVPGTGTTTEGNVIAGDTAVHYTNVRNYVLPETGGTGTEIYKLAGLVLIMTAICLLYGTRRRKRGEGIA